MDALNNGDDDLMLGRLVCVSVLWVCLVLREREPSVGLHCSFEESSWCRAHYNISICICVCIHTIMEICRKDCVRLNILYTIHIHHYSVIYVYMISYIQKILKVYSIIYIYIYVYVYVNYRMHNIQKKIQI